MPNLPESPSTPWSPTTRKATRRSDPLPTAADVCVVGAGIAGVTVAAMLADAGMDVVVLEARQPVAGTTGASSAKVSVLHDHHVEEIVSRSGGSTADAYVAANRFGFAWTAERAAAIDCGWEVQSAVTYATSPESEAAVRREAAELTRRGVAATVERVETPWGDHDAVVVPEQGQFDPVRFTTALLAGGDVTLCHPVRVTGVSGRDSGVEIATDGGTLRARHVVVCTGLPFLDRGLHFARTVPRTSHVVGVRVKQLPPPGMYISAADPVRSVRTVAGDGGEPIVLVGGEGHRTGDGTDTLRCQATLLDWAERHLGVTAVTHRFSAEDYTTPDQVPFAGPIGPGSSDVLVATGFNKWGFTNAPAAARVIAAHLGVGEAPSWTEAFSATRIPLSGVGELVASNAQVARHMVTGWIRSVAGEPRHPGAPVGGPRRPCALSGVCPHLGGVVRWNEAAGTWDCPLHGSRFDRDGSMLHGPATGDLPRS